ncbi:MAG: adenylate/guanylate cyclase domain-containing protein [Ignavibacteria bacterium]
MEKSVRRKDKIRSITIITVIGTIVGVLFTIIAFGYDSARVLKGAVAGFLITFLLGIFENFVFQNRFNKLRFSIVLLIRTLMYVLVISFAVIFVWVVHESSVNDATIFQTLSGNDFKHFILQGDFKSILLFAILTSFLINLFTQVNSLLGKGVLLSYIKGKYHSPKQEERVFMFLDLSSSTTIAEKLDPVTYHKFMNNFFFDIDEPIVETKGQIYQYVGDEVVISWKDNKGFDNANCIRCFFNVRDRIDKLSSRYEKEFGLIPGFKAGLHSGTVVTGEIGDSKREIVFHGDVLNTTARIQTECNALKKKFLVSGDVLEKITLPGEYKSIAMGNFLLRGKAQEVQIFSIEKK